MTARLALSSGNRTAQYIGTTRVSTPSAIPGSTTARKFNGSSDRMVLGRSDELGANYSVHMQVWRGNSLVLADNLVAWRLFTQYGVGVSRVALGFNTNRLALLYTTALGTEILLQSEVEYIAVDRMQISLEVKNNAIRVFVNGRVAIAAAAPSLAAPSTAPVLVGSDGAKRFFNGTIDELAIYQTAPSPSMDNWIRYYGALVSQAYVRDFVASPLGNPQDGAVILSDGFSAQGSGDSSRACTLIPFSNVLSVGPQLVEFSVTEASEPLMFGVFNASHDFSSYLLGDTPHSWAYLEGGTIVKDNLLQQSLAGFSDADKLAVVFDPSAPSAAFYVNGQLRHTQALAPGDWYPAVVFGRRVLTANTGYEVRRFSTYPTRQAVAAQWWSPLSTELRNMEIGTSALLDDGDTSVRHAKTGAVVGLYQAPAPLEAGLTGDPYDKGRRVGGGIKINGSLNTAAGAEFFFGLAFSPEESDMVGTKVLLQSGDKWAIKLIDGLLNCSVGGVQVGTSDAPFEAGKRYVLAISRSLGGTLLVWTHTGYFLQSGDVTALQTSDDVWVGSAVGGGSSVFDGLVSHVFLYPSTPAKWKRDRLANCMVWDSPVLIGSLPTPVSVARAFEPSYRDLLAYGIDASPTATECYAAVTAQKPDEISADYRLVERAGSTGSFAGTEIEDWAVTGVTTTGLSDQPEDNVLTFGPGGLPNIETIAVGTPAMAGNEVFKVLSVDATAGTVTVGRACVDTVPVAHGAGTRVWFYHTALGSNAVAYPQGTEVQMRLLSRTALAEITEDMAPTLTLTMARRAARPYPPAGIRINDSLNPGSVSGTILVSWKHRNKEVQGTALRSWLEDSLAAPTGVTYIVRAFDAATNEQLHESAALPSTDDQYNLFIDGYVGPLLVTVTSRQSGYDSLFSAQLAVEYDYKVEVYIEAEAEEGVAVIPEEGGEDEVVTTESTTTLEAGSFSGDLPDDFAGSFEEEEEEEEGFGAGSLVGVKMSEFDPFADGLSGAERIPMVIGGRNYTITPAQLLDYVTPRIPEPENGQSAYELAKELGFVGSEAAWIASLEGPPGPSTNAARRILSIGAASGAVVCNWSLYDEIRLTLAGDVTLSFSGARDGQGCLLKIRQDATGSRSVTLPGSTRYNTLIQSYAPTPQPGMVDKIGFVYDSAESVYDLVSLVPGLST